MRSFVRKMSGSPMQTATDASFCAIMAIGEPFRVDEGRWIGATVRLFALAPAGAQRTGHADFGLFRIDRPASHAGGR
jgi:hypothetical protein